MSDQKPPELFAERPVRSDFAHGGPSYAVRRVMTVCVVLCLIGGLAWWKSGSPQPSAPGDIPTIKSDGSYKQRPQQPGGIDIPHQDVQVYQELDSSNDAKPQVEHLLPPPEVPQSNTVPAKPLIVSGAPSAAQLEALTPTTSIVTTVMDEKDSKVTEAPMPITPQATPSVTSTASAPAPPGATTGAPPAPVPVKTTATSAPKPNVPTGIDQVIQNVTKAAPVKGSTVIQLAAVPDPETARSTMTKLRAKYAAILSGTSLRVVKADLGAKGIYYRIQSAAVSDEQAKNMCAQLKDIKAGCLIVRP